jgi:TPR repeat protein
MLSRTLFCLVLSSLSCIYTTARADVVASFKVEGISIELSFDEAMEQLESQGYQSRRPPNENRKGRSVTYKKTERTRGGIVANTVSLTERQLDMDMALSEIRAKLRNTAGKAGIEIEHARLVDYFGEEALDCKPNAKGMDCTLGFQCEVYETTRKARFNQSKFNYTIEKQYLDNVTKPVVSPYCPGGSGTGKGKPGTPPETPPEPSTPTEEGHESEPTEETVESTEGEGEKSKEESGPPSPESLTAQEQFELAQQHENGEGVSQSHSKAAELYEMAANQNHAKAQFTLGLKYEKGEGVEQSFEKAAELFRQAAENGLAEAQYNLGVKLEKGEGVGQNQAEAIDNFRKAAEQGESNAQLALAKHYLTGTGVEQSENQAFEWVKKAAEQGNTKAEFLLAGFYESGIGTEQDLEQAIHWYKEANSKEFKPAQQKLYALGINPYPSLEKEEGRKRNAASIPYD